MSHVVTLESIKHSPKHFPVSSSRVTANILATIGGILLLIAAIGAFAAPQQGCFSWLYGFLFFFTLAAGSIFWSVVHHAVHAAWTTLFRRLWENVASLLPALAFLFLPILLFGPYIYAWMQPEVIANDPALHEKDGYLNLGFFVVRAILFFAVFISVALYYRRLSIAQDQDGSPVHSARLQERSFVLLAVYGLSITYASFDWIMSLDYHWSSTMFGVTIFAGAATSSAALIILLTLGLKASGYLEMVNQEHYHLLGKVLFSFVTFWAWVSFSQYLLIWYANIPEETAFYIDRNKGSWAQVCQAMMIFNFAIPFLVLIFQATKRSAFWLGLAAASVLLGHALELYWLVMPTIHPRGAALHWLDIVTWLGMGLVLGSIFVRRCTNDAIYPVRDPRLQEALDTFN